MTELEIESGVIPKRNLEIRKGSGPYIYDGYGNRYLDMGASYGVCNVGHIHPRIQESIEEQLTELIYISSSYDNPVRQELMKKLLLLAPEGMARVFLCNSGTESVEAAVRFAFNATGRSKLVAVKRSFHGRTMGALSLTWDPRHKRDLNNDLMDVDFVPMGDEEALDKAITIETAAFILEPVQGEGGVHVTPADYLLEARRICKERGVLLIVDEVQTGLGRTGKMFAIEHSGVTPDLLCVGKSLGSGIPIAAVLIHEALGPMERGLHGSTFGGSPIACAAASRTLDVIVDEELSERSKDLGDYFLRSLEAIESPHIRNIRGQGLMIAVELKKRAGPILSSLLSNGIAAIPTGSTTIRFLPPLIVTREQIDLTVSVLTEVLDEL